MSILDPLVTLQLKLQALLKEAEEVAHLINRIVEERNYEPTTDRAQTNASGCTSCCQAKDTEAIPDGEEGGQAKGW